MNYRSFMPEVIPNEDYSEAVLIGFRHVIGERGVSCLESLPQYRGVDSLTPQDDFVSIDSACVNGLRIPITKIQSPSIKIKDTITNPTAQPNFLREGSN